MITFNVDNMHIAYLGISIIALGFAIVIAFGKTAKKRRK